MFRVVVLLKGEPPPLTSVFRSLFVPDCPGFSYICVPINSYQLCCSQEKHPNSIMLPSPCFTVEVLCSVLVFHQSCRSLQLLQLYQDFLAASLINAFLSV
ncbi:hypothetical protein AMECASPLE_025980 [Ameca splendens]|uniref:Uncharacterized protein n=1 Tax=Ameca splendens TaxID=208324 RepID=A0ABV0XHS0_9TELE